MPKKTKPSRVLLVAMLSVVVSSVSVTAVMTNAESSQTRTIISYSGMSANSYQPIVPYQSRSGISHTGVNISSSVEPSFSRPVLSRKISQLARTIASVHKRLMAADTKIEVLRRTIATMTRDSAPLLDSLAHMIIARDQLEQQLATLNGDMAELTMELSSVK